MLVLTRKSNQSIMIGDDIEVSVLSVMGDKVRIGIQAPQEVPVFRTEIYTEIHRDDADGSASVAAVPAPDASAAAPAAATDGSAPTGKPASELPGGDQPSSR